MQVHLRSHLPRRSRPPHAPEELAGYWYLGRDRPEYLDYRLGDCGVDPSVQRVVESDCMCPEYLVPCVLLLILILRALSLEVGSAVSSLLPGYVAIRCADCD